MNRTCPHCGAPLPEEAVFCPSCANSINRREEPKPPKRIARRLVWGCASAVLIAAVLIGLWAWQRQPSDASLTYAEAAVLLAETFKYSAADTDATLAPFSDAVDLPDQQREAVAALLDNGIMLDTSDAAFSPVATINRGQAAMLLWLCLGEPEPTRKETPFSDVHGEEEWYWASVSALWKAGILTADDAAGPQGEFAPEDPITALVLEDWLSRLGPVQEGASGLPGGQQDQVSSDAGKYYTRPEMSDLIAWKLQQDGHPDFASYEPGNLTESQRSAVLAVTSDTLTLTTFGGKADTNIFDNTVPLTRAQAAVLLWWVTDCPEAPAGMSQPFSDVVRGGPDGNWGDWPYDVAIAGLYGQGILTMENAAVTDDAFHPAENMLKADMDAWFAAAGIDYGG